MPGVVGETLHELDRLLAPSVRTLREACSVDLTFGGRLDLGSRDSITIRHLDGHLGSTLRHLRVSAGFGLGGKALALGRPIVVRDYFNASQIVHAYDRAVAPERVETALAVPIRLDGTVVGLLYLAQRDDVTFGDQVVRRAVEHARRIERDLAIDVEVRRRVAAQTELAGRDTRALEELLRELEATIALVDNPQARERLLHVSEGLLRVTSGTPAASAPATPAGSLSPREIDVLRLVAAGASNNDIAADLGLMPNTVKAYLRSITRKLGAANRTHAVRLARDARLIP
jgi:DNA-binding CsgD family transcriptional regulator